MKVQATVYKGIEFVRMQELPADQQLLLQLNEEIERIKILVDGKVASDCLQYKDYSAWYSSVFTKSVSPVEVAAEVPVRLAEIAVSKL